MSHKKSKKPLKLEFALSFNLKLSFIYNEMKEIISATGRWIKESIMTILSVIIGKRRPPMF
jgi:hypothetical protein